MQHHRIPLVWGVASALWPVLASAQEAPAPLVEPEVVEEPPVPRVTRPPRPRAAPVNAAPAEPEVVEPEVAEPVPVDEVPLDTSDLQGGETIEIIDDWKGEAQQRRESAEAVQVVETEKAARESADLGEVLARMSGVGVRRAGGLGSAARLSLGGFTDDQIRVFLDGLPLDVAGFALGLANVPVSFVERIEVYRGVVPVRFGADALGGAINLVTDQTWYGTRAIGSYQVGSFGTHRTTAAARHRTASGLVVGTNLFFDTTANDYDVDVEVADDRGKLTPATVARSNDGYRAYGGDVEVGTVERSWARRLTLRGYATRYDKEIPHNLVMTVPYGEARYGGTAIGATLRWDQPDVARSDIDVATVLGYAWRTVDFVDESPWVYDWYGNRVDERDTPGEIDMLPSDQTTWSRDVVARVHLTRRIGARQEVRATVAPTMTWRTGKERMLSEGASRDPESAQRDLLTSVIGAEHEIDAWSDRLENIAFAKHYLQVVATEEILAGGAFRDLDRTTHRAGVGDSLRWRFTPWLWLKASYEWSTRLPRPDEVFGDGVLVRANPSIAPESSHNVNLGVAISASSPSAGKVVGEVTGQTSVADNQIVLLGDDRDWSNQNVYAARSLGVEAVAGWTAPGEWFSLDMTAVLTDKRNTSDQGTFGAYDGDRIPNRPWLQGAASMTLHHRGLLVRGDTITGTVSSRYVHAYFRSWESLGQRDSKQVIPSQLVHGLVATYITDGAADLSFSAEMSNLTDAKAFDYFGVQRPGRALSFKMTVAY